MQHIKTFMLLTALLLSLCSGGAFANEKFVINGRVLHYNTNLAKDEANREINEEDSVYFVKVLSENPDIRTVHLTSWGGEVEASQSIADLLIDYEVDTHAVKICYSGCTTIFLGGARRTMKRGSKIGFHRGWWSEEGLRDYYESEKENFDWENPFAFASWVYEDAQETIHKEFEFLLERGVDSFFAIKTIKAAPDSEDGWYPRRQELRESRFLTE